MHLRGLVPVLARSGVLEIDQDQVRGRLTNVAAVRWLSALHYAYAMMISGEYQKRPNVA